MFGRGDAFTYSSVIVYVVPDTTTTLGGKAAVVVGACVMMTSGGAWVRYVNTVVSTVGCDPPAPIVTTVCIVLVSMGASGT